MVNAEIPVATVEIINNYGKLNQKWSILVIPFPKCLGSTIEAGEEIV